MLGVKGKTKKALLHNFRVKELMRSPVVTISPQEGLKTAALQMAEKKIGCLAVVEDGKLVGLITATDILRHVANS